MAFEGWDSGNPPYEWERILAWDVGGASPHAFVWFALDTVGSIIAYDQIYMVTTDIRKLADLALPKMKDPQGRPYKFRYKVVDYENKIAAEDMRRLGITFDNAIKHGKSASIQRLSGYLHPNPRRPFPEWHPKAGQLGAPLFYATCRCKDLVRELPQQRWKEGSGDSLKDEPDRSVDNHTVDCCLYAVRPLPHPSEVKIPNVGRPGKELSTMSALYWEDVRRQQAKKTDQEARRPYRASHQIDGGYPWELPS